MEVSVLTKSKKISHIQLSKKAAHYNIAVLTRHNFCKCCYNSDDLSDLGRWKLTFYDYDTFKLQQKEMPNRAIIHASYPESVISINGRMSNYINPTYSYSSNTLHQFVSMYMIMNDFADEKAYVCSMIYNCEDKSTNLSLEAQNFGLTVKAFPHICDDISCWVKNPQKILDLNPDAWHVVPQVQKTQPGIRWPTWRSEDIQSIGDPRFIEP